jgi:hypothetical protein
MPSASSATQGSAFTLLDEGRAWTGPVLFEGGTLRLRPDALQAATGWTQKPEGLCLDDVCIPLSVRKDLSAGGQINVNALAEVLDRPLVIDADARAAYLGASAGQRADRLASLQAPDFALPDLSGKMHTLSDQRGRKVLLVAYASW